MSEHCETTQSLRNKLSEFRELPVSDDESWVPLCQIDDSDENDEVCMVVIFGTNKTLGYLKMSDTFHCDATYRHILCTLLLVAAFLKTMHNYDNSYMIF